MPEEVILQYITHDGNGIVKEIWEGVFTVPDDGSLPAEAIQASKSAEYEAVVRSRERFPIRVEFDGELPDAQKISVDGEGNIVPTDVNDPESVAEASRIKRF